MRREVSEQNKLISALYQASLVLALRWCLPTFLAVANEIDFDLMGM